MLRERPIPTNPISLAVLVATVLVATVLVAAGLVGACAGGDTRADEASRFETSDRRDLRRDLESVRTLLARHRDELTARYGAVGLGVGRESLDDDEYFLVVYLPPSAEKPPGEVSIESVPVIFEITGRIEISSPGVSPDPRDSRVLKRERLVRSPDPLPAVRAIQSEKKKEETP